MSNQQSPRLRSLYSERRRLQAELEAVEQEIEWELAGADLVVLHTDDGSPVYIMTAYNVNSLEAVDEEMQAMGVEP